MTAVLAALIPVSAWSQDPTINPHLERTSVAEEAKKDWLHYGPVDVLPNARTGVTYDDNIYIQPTNKRSDLIWSLSPGIALAAGDYSEKIETFGLLQYSPTFLLFTRNGRNNAVDHDGKLDLQYRPGKWIFELQQGFQAYSGPFVDVGNRVDRRLYNTVLGAQYDLSPKTSVGATATQSINDYAGYHSYNEWIFGGYADYDVTPKIKLGAGVNGGFVDIQQSANQQYEQGLLRLKYAASEKLDMRGSAGLELRQFDSGQSSRLNGVYTLGVTYRPVEKTSIVLDTYRRNQTSVVLQNQNYVTTGFSLGVRQAITPRFSAGLAGGYDHLKYMPSGPSTVPLSRVDDYFFIRPTAEWSFNEHWNFGAFYQYRKNNSNSPFQFSNNQVGLHVSWQY
ncbi:MAG TPA: outer membrane beta-barrel protein [Verrucomicrobiae bacterium]